MTTISAHNGHSTIAASNGYLYYNYLKDVFFWQDARGYFAWKDDHKWYVRVSDGVERDLLQKLKLLGGYFSDSGIQTEILEQQDIVRLCNLVNNPAYVHLEDSGINAAIPILESVGVA